MADGDGFWWAKANLDFLLDVFLGAKVVGSGNWSCVARVVVGGSDLPETQSNLYGGGLWLENVLYLVPGDGAGVPAKWVQHTQLIAIPCMLATYFKTKPGQFTFKDGVQIPDDSTQYGEKLQPLKWSAGIQTSKPTAENIANFVATSASEAIDAAPTGTASAALTLKDAAGQTQLRVRARFQAANYQFIYRFDLSDDGKITFGVELTGKTLDNHPYLVHLHQLIAVLVPGKDFVATYLVQQNTGAGANPFAAKSAVAQLEAKKPEAGWHWHDDSVLAFVGAAPSAKLSVWPEGKTSEGEPMGTGLLWWLDPPAAHPVGPAYPGHMLPDLIALDYEKWHALAYSEPINYPPKQIARVAWYAGLNENIDNKIAWKVLASYFGLKMVDGKLPALFTVLRHLHFPEAPENERMPAHYLFQTVRLRGRPG